jgi:hypothetical protein
MNGKSTHSFDTFFVLLIFCLFAVCSLFLVLIGANVYTKIVGQMEANNETRSSLSYVANKVHAAGSGEVSVQEVNGQQTLVIASSLNSGDYRTYIYEYKGSLMELFTGAKNSFTPGSGDKITAVSGFTMSQAGRDLKLAVTDRNRRTLTLDLFLP